MEDFPDRACWRSVFLKAGCRLWCDGGGYRDGALGLVVGGGDIEGIEDLGELLGADGLEGWAQVGDARERGFDLVEVERVGVPDFARVDGVADRLSPHAQLVDALLGERDDRVVGVVVLLHAQALSVKGLIDVFQLGLEACQLAGVPVLVGACAAGEFVP